MLRATRRLTDGPINANFVLEFPIADQLRSALDEGAKIVSFFWGDPGAHVARVVQCGATPIAAVGSIDEAKRAADQGCQAIVAQGWEAGGHVRGTVAMSVLVPAIVDSVPGLPVLAAGGIADSRGVAAAFALGASGVWVGTRFVASREADAHAEYQAALLNASVEDTVHSELFDGGWQGAALRTLRNSTVQKWEAAGRPAPGQRPGEAEPVGRKNGHAVIRFDSDAPTRAVEEGAEAMALYAGQSAGLVHEILPAAQIVAELSQGVPEALIRSNTR